MGRRQKNLDTDYWRDSAALVATKEGFLVEASSDGQYIHEEWLDLDDPVSAFNQFMAYATGTVGGGGVGLDIPSVTVENPRASNPSLYEENRAMIEGLMEAGVSPTAILTSLYQHVAPHILNAALEDTLRDAAREDPNLRRRLALLGPGRGSKVFDTRKPFAPNPDVTGVDGKKRKVSVPKKKRAEIEGNHRAANPGPTTANLVGRLKF